VKRREVKKLYQVTAVILLVSVLPGSFYGQTVQPATAPLPETLTIETATEQFLKRNLSVEAARLQISVAEAERVAARLRPRPGLTLSAENLSVSGETPFNRLYEAGATITQSFELGNQRGLRMEVADRTVAVAEAQLTGVLRNRLFELRRAYYDAVLARTILAIEEENRDNFAELVRFNTVRFEEGDIAEGELIKVRLERIKYDSAAANARLALRQANIRLLEMLGESDYARAEMLKLIGTLEFRPAALDLGTLRQAALSNRAEVKVAEAELARSGSVLRLERARGKGEVTPYVGYKKVGVDNTVLAGVTVPLPFGNRNQGGIARAEAEQRVVETNVRLVRNRALADVETAFRAYETAREQVRAYETGILRQADEARDITMAAYREGVADIVALLDAQRTRSEVRANYYRTVLQYYTSLFQLELATGVEIKL
jgi:outer membrane protein, heavy metal efflux system